MHNPSRARTLLTTGSTAEETMIPGIISAGGDVPRDPLALHPNSAWPPSRPCSRQMGGGSKMLTKNQWFHQVLFGIYRDREVGGKRVASRAVRDAIKEGKLPPLLLLKVDGKEMCLAWHTQGMCNPGQCPRECDHVEYSEQEYAPLNQWCKDNYPK